MSGIIAQNTLDNSGLIKSPAGGGAWNFIKKLTASGSGDLSFVDGTSDVVLDSTYKEYLFTFKEIHLETDGENFQFNVSIDSGSNYNVAKTTTHFRTYQSESAGSTNLVYFGGSADLHQGTGVQFLSATYSNANDASLAGTLHLFNPSSTTFIKHFVANTQYEAGAMTQCSFVGGYANTTSAVNAIQFSMGSGNIDSGDICLYGITT